MHAARRLAAEVLAPAAEDTDRSPAVPRSHLDALARAGLNGLTAPVDAGGAGAPPAVVRAVYEALAGACGVTFFTWVQHHAPIRMLAASDNTDVRERWLPRLAGGEVLGGVAFAYLRRPGPPAVVARRVAGGWAVDGEAPWVTSWGLARFFSVAARVAGDGPVLFLALATERQPAGVRASAPLALAAMSASSTVRLRFESLFVPDVDVVASVDVAEWRDRDRVGTAQPHPAPLGLATTAVRLLRQRAGDSGQPAVTLAADALAGELDDCRRTSYEVADEGATDDAALGPAGPGGVAAQEAQLARLVGLRAWGLDLAMRSAQALVAASGGASMAVGHPAQRLLREAAFWSIQAQTTALRAATLDRLSRDRGRPPAQPR